MTSLRPMRSRPFESRAGRGEEDHPDLPSRIGRHKPNEGVERRARDLGRKRYRGSLVLDLHGP